MNIWIIYQRIIVLCYIGDFDDAEQMYKVSAILHQLE